MCVRLEEMILISKRIIIEDNILTEMIKKYLDGSSALKLSKEYPYSQDVIRRNLKDKGIGMRGNSYYRTQYELNHSYFDNIDSEAKAYWLGFFYADGYISKHKHGTPLFGISLSKRDESHLEKFKSDIESTYPVKTYKVTGGYKVGIEYVRLLMKSQNTYEKLKEYGVDHNKSKTCTFPSSDIVDEQYQRHFIRGYFDGNGSIAKHSKSKKGQQEYCLKICGTKEMLEAIASLMPVNINKLSQRHPDRDNNNYSLEIGGRRQVVAILNFLYMNSNISLDRKRELYDRIINT